MSANKKTLYVIGNLISTMIAFLITKVPNHILQSNFFDEGLVGYDLIRYALISIAWIIFLLFVAIQVAKVIKFLIEK